MDKELKKLNGDKTAELMDLFVHCFRNDHYYISLFPGSEDIEKDMREKFYSTLEYCVVNDGAFGIYDNNSLVAFILSFDYHKTKSTNASAFKKIFSVDQKSALKYKKEIHDRIDALGENVIFMLSMGVHESYQRKGYASFLIDFMMSSYQNYYLVGDVSSKLSLPIYEKRGFHIDTIEEEYYFIKLAPAIDLFDLSFKKKIQLALPDADIISEIPRLRKSKLKAKEINGYGIVPGKPYATFFKQPDLSCLAYIAEVTYEQLLSYQRYINLSRSTEECFKLYDDSDCLIYMQDSPLSENNLWNEQLRDMVKDREQEWSVIPDAQILIPVEYMDKQLLDNISVDYDKNMIAFLRLLDHRTHYETKEPEETDDLDEPEKKDNDDDFSLPGRIKRYYLGKMRIKITMESTVDTYTFSGNDIGVPADVDIVLSIDKRSECGVFSIISLSTPFLISHLLDNIARNQLNVLDGNEWVNIYKYIRSKFGLRKRGTAKSYITIPNNRNCLTSPQISSLLFSETIYPNAEELGRVVDPEIVGIVESKHGMGQYDRSYVCVHTNVFIQFYPDFRTTCKIRLLEGAITFFYIEVLMFEEAAIQIADQRIIMLLSDTKKANIKEFLDETLSVHTQYASTIEFWDKQVHYPSSRRSVEMIRKAFKLDEQLVQMKRNEDELRVIFNTKRDISDRRVSIILNYILLFMACSEGLANILPWFFGEAAPSLPHRFSGISLIAIVIVLYFIYMRRSERSR